MTELYDRLIERNKQGEEYSSAKLREIADKINGFDNQAAEMTFVLIRIYSLRNGKEPFQIPYEGKAENKTFDGHSEYFDMIFNLEKLPPELISLLCTFVQTVEESKGESIGPNRSKSPRNKPVSDASSSTKSFMKKTAKPLPIIVLRQIDFANLDKTFAMNEIVKYGEKSLILDSDLSSNTTNVGDIGIKNDPSHSKMPLVIYAEDPLSADEREDEYTSLSVYHSKQGSLSRRRSPSRRSRGHSRGRSKSPTHSFTRRLTSQSPVSSRKEKSRRRREHSKKKREEKGICETCFYCTLSTPLDWEVIQIYDGCFCSFHCARSYAMEYKLSLEPLLSLYKTYTGSSFRQIIAPAPDRRLLEKFGGSMTEAEYRDLFNSPMVILNLNQNILNPMCNSSDVTEGYSSYRSKTMTSTISFKEAPKLSFDSLEPCTRIYKTN